MFGLVLALVWFAFVAFVNSSPMTGYQEATSFLFWWYAVCEGLVVGLMVGITGLGALGVGVAGATLGRSKAERLLGFAGGAMAGGAIGGFGTLLVSVYAALYVGGAWLLCHAADGARDLSHLNTTKLVIGGVMILIGVIASRSSSNSSSSSQSHSNDD